MNLKNRWNVKGAGGGFVVNRERFVEGVNEVRSNMNNGFKYRSQVYI